MFRGLLVVSLLSVVFGSGCSSYHEVGDEAPNSLGAEGIGGPNNVGADTVAIFEKTLFPLITQNCTQCHGANQSPLFAEANPLNSQQALIGSGLIVFATPANSRIVQKVLNGHQGFPQTLAGELEAAIQAWKDGLMEAGGDSILDAPPPALEPKFASIQKLILVPKCLGCHSPGGERPDEDYSNYETTMDTGGVEAGDADGSEMYKECESGSMPDGDAPPLSTEELATLKEWIDNGAENN